jgi:hypothetical protein
MISFSGARNAMRNREPGARRDAVLRERSTSDYHGRFATARQVLMRNVYRHFVGTAVGGRPPC